MVKPNLHIGLKPCTLNIMYLCMHHHCQAYHYPETSFACGPWSSVTPSAGPQNNVCPPLPFVSPAGTVIPYRSHTPTRCVMPVSTNTVHYN